MAGRPRYNWNTIPQAYVSGGMYLVDLSREATGLKSDPPYQSIRRAAATDPDGSWDSQRRAYRYNLATVTATTPTAQQVQRQTSQLVDAAEAIARHIQLAKSLQGSYATIQAKLKQLKTIENMDFSQLDPAGLTLVLSRLATIAATSADIERKALGLSDPATKIEVGVTGNVDYSVLTDDQLRTITIAAES